MVMVALLVFGLYSYQRLAVEQLPDIDLPVVAVLVTYPGASPSRWKMTSSSRSRTRSRPSAGIDTLSSTARPNAAMIVISRPRGELGGRKAAEDVREKVASIEADLPPMPKSRRSCALTRSAMPVMSLAVRSEATGLSPAELTELADDVVVERLRNIPGVGSATLVGGVPSQLDVLVDPDRLDAFGVSMTDVLSAIGHEQCRPAGRHHHRGQRRVLHPGRRPAPGCRGLCSIIVARKGGQAVRLADVATVTARARRREEPRLHQWRARHGDRHRQKVQGANTVGVAKAIHKELDKLKAGELPDGVEIDIVRDNAVPVSSPSTPCART